MWPILFKEIKTVFNDLIGFLVIGLFLLLNTLFLWVLDSSFNILQAGFADLTLFFELAPWLLLLVIPALSMRSFAEEIKNGTLEILLSKPLSISAVVFGKFLGVFCVALLALLPTLSYIYLLHILLPEAAIVDWGMLVGGYLGLLLFISMLAALGIYMSSVTSQQTTAFLLSIFVGFAQFYLWGQLAAWIPSFFWHEWVASLGMQAHYSSLNRGVLLPGDICYFLASTLILLLLTQYRIKKLQAQ
jgi:ABC-2 type transport system permease protein